MTKNILSWGRHPNQPQVGSELGWRGEAGEVFSQAAAEFGSTLPFGNGRSYGDSCLAVSGCVIETRRMNRVIEFDRARGTFCAESGITLEEILHIVVPAGWFLAVTPGTQHATLGGAIANDVHGKNHHKQGTFGGHVKEFGLLRSDDGYSACAPDTNPNMFNATIGGLGLTGLILWARIQLIPIASAQINTQTIRFESLLEFFELSERLDDQHEYSVAWIDCLAKGAQAGRGVYFFGDHAPYGELTTQSRRPIAMGVTPPVSLINKYSLAAFNEVYWRKHSAKPVMGRCEYEPFFYPLDRISGWNRMYGPRGFQQYQCVIPEAEAYSAMTEILKAISDFRQGSFLAVLKRCGRAESPGLISFPMPGISLALDFPQTGELETKLFKVLDGIVRTARGRLYPAKDAHMKGDDFKIFYPNWQQLEIRRDPQLNSLFWKRVSQ
jgi:FAD/FMN-containing dehydrogenase